MAIEIEKKFLLTNESWKKDSTSEIYFQGYISSGTGKTVRVRIAGEKGFLTIKGKHSGLSRMEFEYPIPLDDAKVLLKEICEQPIIHKKRYRVEHSGFLWEIDEFYGENLGLVMAEIELENENQEFPIPEWLGREVSHDGRYYNASLRRNPYCNWKDSQ
jgi:adenylate cyclase